MTKGAPLSVKFQWSEGSEGVFMFIGLNAMYCIGIFGIFPSIDFLAVERAISSHQSHIGCHHVSAKTLRHSFSTAVFILLIATENNISPLLGQTRTPHAQRPHPNTDNPIAHPRPCPSNPRDRRSPFYPSRAARLFHTLLPAVVCLLRDPRFIVQRQQQPAE